MVGHEYRRHHDLHDVERFATMLGIPFQKVAVRKDTHDVVHGILVHGQARMAFAVQHLHQIFQRRIHIDSAHVHSRGHDFAHRRLHEIEDIQDHLLFFFFEAFFFAVFRIGKVRLHGVTHFFGKEAQLGIVAKEAQHADKDYVTNLRHRDKGQARHAEQRNEDYRQSIRLEICNQIREKYAHDIDDNAGDHDVRH